MQSWLIKIFGSFDMERILVSIVIPTYNSAECLERCLNSIKIQSFTNFEVIVIDNVSNDKTLDIVNRFSKGGLMINCISRKDSGVYDAMNNGIKEANGEWIYFLGSDDYLLDNYVLLKFSEYISDSKMKAHLMYGNVNSHFYGDKYAGEFDVHKIMTKNICHQAIFYNRKIFDLVGLFNLKYKILADYDFNLRCFFSHRVKVKYIDMTVAYFSDGGISNTIVDDIFYSDYSNKAEIVKKVGYKKLTIKELRPYYDSSTELLLVIIKKYLNRLFTH
ncbi:glycosyltransferase [Flavisolibacter sp. BT320]|nr:glycosyltransferase [Flavisolibacter longurius]